MDTMFDAAAFRASPFMAALTAVDAIPETEKRIARRQANKDRWANLCRAENRIMAQFYRTIAICHDGFEVDHDSAKGAAMLARHAVEMTRLCAMLDEWIAIPCNNKSHAIDRSKWLYKIRNPAMGTGTYEVWRPRYEAWMATLDEQRVAFEAITPSKKRGR